MRRGWAYACGGARATRGDQHSAVGWTKKVPSSQYPVPSETGRGRMSNPVTAPRVVAQSWRAGMPAPHVLLLVGSILLALSIGTAEVASAQGPALTTIQDTVYRADGTAASGVVLISWPTFQTADGDAVAAGRQSVTLGAGGGFVAQLVPNAGALPAGTMYVAVFQLDDGTVRTEYWTVPTTSPTTLAAIRTTPGTSLGNMAATQQYVNAAVANRALDANVVHLSGAETITGLKQFATAPSLPLPVANSDAANKSYVDTAVENVGSGNYVSKAGDTMTGPLTLAGAPTAPNQAANRQYVDSGLAAKADLIAGLVPTAELGSGVASSSTCLTGNSTWGSCGGGAPAGITYATTALNWSRNITNALTGGTQGTVTLAPCPVGIDTTSGLGYQAFLSGGGNSEAVNVTGGTCTSGGPSGTISFTPYYSYPAGSTIGSASSGIQETINAACGTSPDSAYWNNAQCNVTIPANGPFDPPSLNTYNVYGTIFFHTSQSILSGPGVTLRCQGRGPCLWVGAPAGGVAGHYKADIIQGLSFRSPTNLSSQAAFNGSAITNTSYASNVATITTAAAHGFRPGDLVTILFTDNKAYWGDAVVQTVPTPTTFTFTKPWGTIGAQSTPGVVALAYEAILDSGVGTHFTDIQYDFDSELGAFNNFFDFWDDENALVDHFNNNGIPLNANYNWTGSFLFSGGNPMGSVQWAPVITLRDSSITANYSNCATVYNSNGLYIENTVCQASGPWQFYSANSLGNYQGAYLKNIYSESAVSMNPPCSPSCPSGAKSPFPGTGIAGLIAGPTAVGPFQIAGNGGVFGGFATGGSGSTAYSYFIVAKDCIGGTWSGGVCSSGNAKQTSPMQVLNYSSTGSDSIAVRWPRVANGPDGIAYDIVRMATPGNGVGAVYPYAGGCGGGTTLACGSVATNVAQCSGLVCSYTDSGSAVTANYSIQPGTYAGNLAFWPGSIVAANHSVTVDVEAANVVGVGLNGNPLQIASQCSNLGTASPGGYTACVTSMTSTGYQNQTATLMSDGAPAGGGETLTKGRLNFSMSPFANLQAHHIITLIDSQPGLTQAISTYRPPASANDTWIGTDVTSPVAPSFGQLAFGSPVSITNYIAQPGNGTNWLEKLTASLKEFNVAVKFDQGVVLPQANGYVPPTGGIGLDTTAGLPVVNLGGTTHQVAFTSSNISGQAGTALALAATPTQCSGSFATGIAANGNANCTTPNVIQMQEQPTPPPGIPNWGVFWFDAATHSPRIIENNGQVMQLGMTNLFNTDPGGDPADSLEERNGANPQSLRVYSSYTSNSAWDRISLGSENLSGTFYNELRSENANSGNAANLGIRIGSNIKWIFGNDGTFKPNTIYDGLVDIGTDTGQAMRSVFAKTSFNIYNTGRQDFEFANDGTSGTTLNQLAIYNSAGTGVQTASTSSTDGVVGIVSGGAGTSGKAVVTWAGVAACLFDAVNPTAGDYAVASTTQAGKCHDTGSKSRPTSVQVIGRIEAQGVRVSLAAPSGGTPGGGAVTSVFGRIGDVVAASGDYSVAQVTGAAADSAVVHLAGAETISGAKTFSSDVTMSGNLNVAGTINQTGTAPTQWSGKEWSGTSVTVPSGMDYSLGVGSDGALKCQLAGGGSCMPAGGGGVTSVFGRTGAVTAASGDYSVSQVTGAAPLASPTFTGSPMAPTAGAGDNSTKLATTAYVKNEVYLAWTCPVAGATTTGVSYCNWTLPVGLTITGFDLAASTAPAGCTTYPTLQVWDGTANAEVGSYSVTMSSGQNFYNQVTGSANVTAGHLLRVKVTTGGAGCGTSPAGIVAAVTYQMQN